MKNRCVVRDHLNKVINKSEPHLLKVDCIYYSPGFILNLIARGLIAYIEVNFYLQVVKYGSISGPDPELLANS